MTRSLTPRRRDTDTQSKAADLVKRETELVGNSVARLFTTFIFFYLPPEQQAQLGDRDKVSPGTGLNIGDPPKQQAARLNYHFRKLFTCI